MPIERKLAAIMFTDIAGYTALSAKDENKALALLDTQKQILTPIIEEFNGTLHKEVGDGLLFTFPTVTEAVRCGIKIQEQTKSNDDLNLRIGIHEGEITLKDGDALGDDVNVASRIEAFAPSGGIAISSKVQQNISSLPEFETSYVCKPELKGVSQEVKVYCITSHGLPKAEEIAAPIIIESNSNFNVFALIGGVCVLIAVLFIVFTGEEEEKVPSIAIIPLENKGDKKDEFYSYSISSDLISDVSSAGDIRVASLKDIEKLDYKSLTNNEIAKKLFVRYISQGTLWKVDSIFLLSMELYDTKKNKIKWSKNWQQNWSELPSIKGGLSEYILTNLQVTTKQDITKSESENAEAYELYLKAKNIYEKRENTDDTKIAQGLLNKAIELDDNLISAKLLLGDTYRERANYDQAIIGDTYREMGYYNKAMEIFSSALTKSEELNDKLWIGRSNRNIGNVHSDKGDYDTALDYWKKALEVSEEIGDKYGMGASLGNIGEVHAKKGDYDKALDYYGRSLAIQEEIGDKSGMGYSLYNIGLIHHNKGDLDTALDYYGRSLAIQEEIGDKRGIGNSLSSIGVIHFNKGDNDKALDYFGRSLAIREELGDKSGVEKMVYLIGYAHLNNSEYGKALEYFDRSLELEKKFGDKYGLVETLFITGITHSKKGDLDKALDYFGRSLAVSEEIGDKRWMGVSLGNIGDVHAKKGDYDKALDYYGRSLKIDKELGDKYGMGSILNNIGIVHYDKGDLDTALDYYKRSLAINEELGNKRGMGNNLLGIGNVYSEKGDYEKALEYLEKSLFIQNETGSKEIELRTTTYLYLTYKHLGKDYDVNEIHTIIKDAENIEFEINLRLYELLEDKSYLETAYNQIQKLADNLEPDVAAKFLSYPIPKAIVEEWEKVK